MKNKHQGHAGGLLISSQADNVLFSYVLNLFTVYYLSVLLMTLRDSNPLSVISQAPPDLLGQGLVSYWCFDGCLSLATGDQFCSKTELL